MSLLQHGICRSSRCSAKFRRPYLEWSLQFVTSSQFRGCKFDKRYFAVESPSGFLTIHSFPARLEAFHRIIAMLGQDYSHSGAESSTGFLVAKSTPTIAGDLTAKAPDAEKADFCSVFTPPESPKDNEDCQHGARQRQSTKYPTPGAQTVVVGDAVYTASQIRVMAEQVAQARRAGRFPITAAQYSDGRTTVEDYQLLIRLCRTRSDTLTSNPDAYKRLYQQVERRIQERDVLLQDAIKQSDGSWGSNFRLRPPVWENQYHKPAHSLRQARGSDTDTQLELASLKENVCSVIEDVVERNIADATGPLRININRLHQENEDLKDLNDILSRQIDMHFKNILEHTDAHQSHIKALEGMFETHTKNIQATTENLTVVTALAGHLSQVVMNLPNAVDQIVRDTVQHRAQEALEHILETQREAMHHAQQQSEPADLLDNPNGSLESSTRAVDTNALAASISRYVSSNSVQSSRNKCHRRGKTVAKVARRIFRGRRQHSAERRGEEQT